MMGNETTRALRMAAPIFLFTTVLARPAGAQQAPNAMYVTGELHGLAGMCLDVRGPSTDNGTPVQIWKCGGGLPQQRWTLTRGGEIRGLGNKCLDVRGPSTTNGTQVQIWDCAAVPQQHWTLTPSGELRGIGGMCLDVRGPSTDNGTPVQIWECANVPQQRWEFARP